MKLHTSLGISPRKKLALSAAAVALIGSVSPIYANNVHAIQSFDPPTLYALVGPDYYTSFPELGPDSGTLTYQVADTSIADFYTNTRECSRMYTCLQGKKIGETEVIINVDGEEFGRAPLISAEMTPKATTLNTFGKVINVTGSLNGADDDILNLNLLTAPDVYSNVISYEQTGPRSFRIDTTDTTAGFEAVMLAGWNIGTQFIGGGSYYLFYNIGAEDRINGSEDTEDILRNAFLGIMEIVRDGYNPTADIVSNDGSIFHRTNSELGGEPKYTKVILDRNEASISKTEEEKHLEKLPENIKDVSFDNISAKTYVYYSNSEPLNGEGGGDVLNAFSSELANEDDDYEHVEMGEFIKLGTAINVTLDASDAPAVKDGYTRKYYVTITKNNGEVEVVDAEYDAENKKFTFAISEFGNIAYGYVDEEIKEEPAGESVAPKVPNTGSPIQKVAQTAAITFAPLAAIVFGAFMVRSKKRSDNKLAKKHNHFE